MSHQSTLAMNGQKKGIVNIKVRLDFKNTAREILHTLLSYAIEHSQAFSVFHLIDPMNGRSASPTSFTTGAIVQSSPHAFIWHLLRISNAERPLQLQRRSTFVFCNTKLSQPTN